MLVSPASHGDFVWSATATTSNREASLAFRVQNQSNGYLLIFEPDGLSWRGGGAGGIWFARRVAGVESYLSYWHPAAFPSVGQSANLKVSGTGSHFEIFLNGASIGSLNDATFASGKVGLRIFGDASLPNDATFSNISLGTAAATNFRWYVAKNAPGAVSECDKTKPVPQFSPVATGICVLFDFENVSGPHTLRYVFRRSTTLIADESYPWNWPSPPKDFAKSFNPPLIAGSYHLDVLIDGAVIGSSDISISLSAAKRKYVVFLRGLPSQLTADRIAAMTTAPCSDSSNDPDFGLIRSRLTTIGYICSDFLDFSYTGGTLGPTQRWTPGPYTCKDSGQAHTTSVAKLVSMLEQFSSSHQTAEFVLVGHSQGGLLAFETLEELKKGTVNQVLPITKVVTLDSPLEGVRLTADLRIFRFISPSCQDEMIDSQARTDLFLRYGQNLRDENNRTVEWALGRGKTVMTLGNWDDCIYSLRHCRSREPFHIVWNGRIPSLVVDEEFPDSALAQVVKAAQMHGLTSGDEYRLYDFCLSLLPISCGSGHSDIKINTQAVEDIVGFIGSQGAP